MSKIVVFDHPLIQHKITLLRDCSTGTRDFRILIEEIATLMGYEALRDLPTEMREVKTPCETTRSPVIAGPTIAVIPILRAGLGMVKGLLALVPNAKVGHIGMYRDPDTHLPHEYYAKLPENIEERVCVVLDPMLATGGSACAAVELLKKKGVKRIKFMSVLAAPEGLGELIKHHPDIELYCGHLDRELSDSKYILPGLGDAGDRIFGTL